MKKYIALIAALFALVSCYKPYVSKVDLGVNDTRVNITWTQVKEQPLDFVFPVYSTGAWTARIVAGGDWLTIDRTSGEGNQYIKCNAQTNTLDIVRAVRMEVSNGKKTIPVYFVVSSSTLSAADIADAELDNYLI
ncbi:MAG: BACON domain-containing protein [Bacteroidales bacterium]|nr:BACON domain-containing protein [Bacteroidales bacterium]